MMPLLRFGTFSGRISSGVRTDIVVVQRRWEREKENDATCKCRVSGVPRPQSTKLNELTAQRRAMGTGGGEN